MRKSFRGLDVTLASGVEEGTATLRASRNGEIAWTCDLRILDRVGELYPRWFTRVVGEYLLVFSDGEHYRGATSHEQQLHCIDDTGRVRFSLSLDAEEPAFEADGSLLVCNRLHRRFPPTPEPLFEIVVIDPDQGQIVSRTPVPLPIAIVEAMKRDAPKGYPPGKLERHGVGHRFVGRVWVGGQSMPYTFPVQG